MLLFPPYFDTGGLFGGVRFAFVLLPPTPISAIDFRPAVPVETLLLQISVIACFVLGGIRASDPSAGASSKNILAFGAFCGLLLATSSVAFTVAGGGRGWTPLPFLFCMIPINLPGGYFLFWHRLAIIALLTFAIILVAARRSQSGIPVGLVITTVSAVSALVGVATIHAAMR